MNDNARTDRPVQFELEWADGPCNLKAVVDVALDGVTLGDIISGALKPPKTKFENTKLEFLEMP